MKSIRLENPKGKETSHPNCGKNRKDLLNRNENKHRSLIPLIVCSALYIFVVKKTKMVKHYQWVFEKKSPVTSLPPGHCTPWNILKLWVNKTMGKRLDFQTASVLESLKKASSSFLPPEEVAVNLDFAPIFQITILNFRGWTFISGWYLMLS